jgi:uncharacterized protein
MANVESTPQNRGRKKHRRLAWFLAGCLFPIPLFLASVMLFEKQFIFFPSTYEEGDPAWDPEPLGAIDVFFESEDGVRLHGWYAAHPSPRAVVLYCHGNAGDITYRSDILTTLRDRTGVSVFLFDYRGYGRSEGSPSEKGLYADAQAARDWLAEKEGINPQEIVLMGRSLGGSVATELAVSGGAKALILESTFTSIPDMAKETMPWLPGRSLIRNRFETIDKIGRYEGPLFHSHGDVDSIVPFQHGETLFAAAISAEPKIFYTIEGRDHNDRQPLEYYDRLAAFLEKIEN